MADMHRYHSATSAGQALQALADAIAEHDWLAMRAVLHDDLEARYLHTGESFDADGLLALTRDYPGAWTYHRDEIVDAGRRGVLRSHTVIGTQTWHAASFATVDESGLIVDLVEVWTEAVSPHPERNSP